LTALILPCCAFIKLAPKMIHTLSVDHILASADEQKPVTSFPLSAPFGVVSGRDSQPCRSSELAPPQPEHGEPGNVHPGTEHAAFTQSALSGAVQPDPVATCTVTRVDTASARGNDGVSRVAIHPKQSEPAKNLVALTSPWETPLCTLLVGIGFGFMVLGLWSSSSSS
jgi:hypothetical protein